MKKVAIFGDSVSKGVIYDTKKKRYTFDNGIEWDTIEKRLNIKIENYSKMGATISYGYEKLKKYLETNPEVDTIVIEYGGNDCDFDWVEVANTRSKDHQPKTPIPQFKRTLVQMIKLIESKNIKPLLLTLPSINAKRYYKWITRNIEHTENILYFLGDVEHIYRHHELYNITILEVANEYKVDFIDIRKVFLHTDDVKNMICQDGIHPTVQAEKLIVNDIIQHFEMMSEQSIVVPNVRKFALNFYQKGYDL